MQKCILNAPAYDYMFGKINIKNKIAYYLNNNLNITRCWLLFMYV